MKYYLGGPMSGLPQFNFPAFYKAANDLRSFGYNIISPAELDDPNTMTQALNSETGDPSSQTKTWGEFLARDVKIVADEVQGIIFLPGWEMSRGARLEAYVGLLCGHKFELYDPYNLSGPTRPIPAQYVRGIL